jgi:predicted nuclease of predicted toxin-antitoxin system
VKWLLDEMLPPAAAEALTRQGHDARSVRDVGLRGRADREVIERAVREGRALVTEDVADYSRLLEERLARGEPCVPVVFVRRTDMPRGRVLADRLARKLTRWAEANPDPYLGPHWPK